MTLLELREKIDEIDRQIVTLLEQRMLMVDEIKKIKEEEGLLIEDRDREREVKNKKSSILHPWDIERIFDVIIRISKEHQQEGP
ncbi:MAG: chorismate mutase [Theionarchaea archaeon]|nr:chorismate mutase [Theionarchaea archaeon]